MRSILKNICFFLKVFFISTIILNYSAAEARWMTKDEAWIEYDLYNTEIKIDSNGLSEELTEFKYKILKENGKKENSFYFEYDANSEKLEILEAYISRNGEKQKTLHDFSEKDLLNNSEKINDLKQITLSFPGSEIGSEIYIKFKITQILPQIANFYSSRFSFFDKYLKNFNIKITSELPLNIEKNDPKNLLKITQKNDPKKKIYKIEIDLLKPLIQQLANYYDPGSISAKDLVYVNISSETKWTKFVKFVSKSYQDILDEPIPSVFENILDFSKDIDNEVDKINIVTSNINEKILYEPLLENRKERFFPQNLEKIAESLSGNSRDFAAITAAILNRLNFKVEFAFIWKGVKKIQFESKVPLSDEFNWVILKVTGKNGKIYWIDPTNLVSMANGILPDIANKQALVLNNNFSPFETIPDINPLHSQIIKIEEIEILDKKMDKVDTKIKLLVRGEQALDFTALNLKLPEEDVKRRIFSFGSGLPLNYFDKVKNLKMNIPKLNSRIVKDLNIDLSYQIEERFSNSNSGKLTKIPLHNLITDIANCPENKIENLMIGPISTYERIFIIKNLKLLDLNGLNYTIDNKWFSLKRSTEYRDKDSLIKVSLVVKQNFIESEAFKTAEFRKLKRELNMYFEDFFIILRD